MPASIEECVVGGEETSSFVVSDLDAVPGDHPVGFEPDRDGGPMPHADTPVDDGVGLREAPCPPAPLHEQADRFPGAARAPGDLANTNQVALADLLDPHAKRGFDGPNQFVDALREVSDFRTDVKRQRLAFDGHEWRLSMTGECQRAAPLGFSVKMHRNRNREYRRTLDTTPVRRCIPGLTSVTAWASGGMSAGYSAGSYERVDGEMAVMSQSWSIHPSLPTPVSHTSLGQTFNPCEVRRKSRCDGSSYLRLPSANGPQHSHRPTQQP